jgi:hypothetical protein
MMKKNNSGRICNAQVASPLLCFHKSEARSTKSETILNDQNPNVPNTILPGDSGIPSFGHLDFEIGICFEFRDSDFEFFSDAGQGKYSLHQI